MPYLVNQQCISCPSPNYFNKTSNACLSCPINTSFSAAINNCTTIVCTSGKMFNEESKRCECPANTSFEYNNSCNRCQQNYFYSVTDKLCLTCPNNTVYNSTSNSCSCN